MPPTGLRAAKADPLPIQIAVKGLEIGPEDTVVDVGCGAGFVCAYAGRRRAAVIGIDVDNDAVGQADEAMRGVPARSWTPIQSRCDPIPLPDATATVVIATEVLEHVADPARFLAELVRIGRPGARYVVTAPHPASESVMGAVAPAWYWREPFHVRVFREGELDDLIRSAGLEVTATAARGFQLAVWWVFRFALGAQIAEPPPTDHPLLAHWDAAWKALDSTPGGTLASEALDRLLPKSQLVLARKPGGGPSASSFGGPTWSRAWWKRRLRDGGVRLGGYDLRWSVRRAKGG
jgi:SAM-dependent methyltransferase